MEQKPENIGANETGESVEFRRRDCNIPPNPIESESCRMSSASPGLCVSNSSDQPGTSTLTRFDTANHYSSLDIGEMSSANPATAPILRSLYLRNDTRIRVEDTHNAYDAGYSNSKEETNHEGEWSCSIGQEGRNEFISNDKDPLDLCSRKELKRVLMSVEDVKVSSSSQTNMDSSISNSVTEHPISVISHNGPIGEISARAMEGPNNVSSSNVEGIFASSFSNFFFGRIRSTMRKSVPHGNSRTSNESHTTSVALTQQNENVQMHASGEASDALMDRNPLSCQHYPRDIARKELELPHCGVNLREWLESKGVNASKNEKMLLFRQIVKIVNTAHSRGIALLELWPSSFILFETGDVKYVGSLIEIEDNAKKRSLEPEIASQGNFRAKMQNVGGDKLLRPQSHLTTTIVEDKVTDNFNRDIIGMKKSSNYLQNVQDFSIGEGTYIGKSWLTSQNAQLEKKWYAFPQGSKTGDLLSLNIYSLGLMLFEFLCHFELIEAHSAAMQDLHHRILPPVFLSENHMEAGFCFWLLHPQPSSRPTTREILQSNLMSGPDTACPSNDEASCVDMVDDAESDLLIHFLVTLMEDKQNKACNLSEILKFLDSDIKMVETGKAFGRSSELTDGGYDTNVSHQVESPYSSIYRVNVPKDKLLGDTSELENAYFSVRSNRLAEMPDMTRSDKDVLWKRYNLMAKSTEEEEEEKSVDRVGTFLDGVCKFARYNKFEVCGTLRNGDILNSNNAICSLCFDPEEEYIAAAGVSKKIKIFELHSLLNDSVDIQYPVLEMSNKSKFSCICWNSYIKSYLASTDHDGVVQIWDASTGQGFGQYKEHQKRAWSIDFSRVDPIKFASGSDDCSLKLWSINERNSTGTIRNPANICCVQFSSYSSHLLVYGSADYRIYCYDLRHTRIPWCTLAGHENAVSYVKFLDAETLVSASMDNTLKLWDLKATSLDGLSPDACSSTLRGHTNEKNFVGLAVLDGYIACGSETNEVYAYYRSLPMPITSHKFGSEDANNNSGHFVSSLCWRRKSQMIAAANSSGTINILRLAKST